MTIDTKSKAQFHEGSVFATRRNKTVLWSSSSISPSRLARRAQIPLSLQHVKVRTVVRLRSGVMETRHLLLRFNIVALVTFPKSQSNHKVSSTFSVPVLGRTMLTFASNPKASLMSQSSLSHSLRSKDCTVSGSDEATAIVGAISSENRGHGSGMLPCWGLLQVALPLYGFCGVNHVV